MIVNCPMPSYSSRTMSWCVRALAATIGIATPERILTEFRIQPGVIQCTPLSSETSTCQIPLRSQTLARHSWERPMGNLFVGLRAHEDGANPQIG